jgi:hypothetical protein
LSYPVLVQHAKGSHGEIVNNLHAREQRKAQKQAGNAAKRHQQVYPTEQNLPFVPDDGPSQIFNVHVRFILFARIRFHAENEMKRIRKNIKLKQPTIENRNQLPVVVFNCVIPPTFC